MDRVTLDESSQSRWQRDGAERLRYEYNLTANDLVVDVGAYRGEFATEIYRRYGCRILAIEPTDSIWNFKDGEIVNKAASTANGFRRFGGAFYYTSIYEEGKVSYECFDLNPVLAARGEIALLKMNVEGAEYELMPHILDAGLQRQIRNFQIQFHQIADEPFDAWYSAICAKLAETHELTYKYPFCWENWRLSGLPKDEAYASELVEDLEKVRCPECGGEITDEDPHAACLDEAQTRSDEE